MATSASAEVFAIPELLENILFQLACQCPDSLHNHIQYSTVQPAHQLFVIQRVSTTFRDVIHGSKKILESTFVARTKMKPDKWVDHHPFNWLCQELGLKCGRSGPQEDPRFNNDYCSMTSFYERDFILGRNKAFFRPEASWREMKVTDKNITAPFTVLYEYDPGASKLYSVALKFVGMEKATLGPFWDKIDEVETRKREEHRAAIKRAKKWGPQVIIIWSV